MMTQSQANLLPKWRGFNLLDLFTIHSDGDFKEDDFRWMAEWGFNFARIPACYTLWTEPVSDPRDLTHLSEAGLAKVDRVIRLGEQYGIHVCFNFHRGPGFSVNPERQEPFDLWKDSAALEAFNYHWQAFARRYQGISSEKLSFNLINEPIKPSPDGMTRADHERVMRSAVQAVRAVDPDRLIILDGVSWGNETLPELADLAGQNVAQSCRAYVPMNISHYQANWVDSQGWPEPSYPGVLNDGLRWDRARLEAHYAPWIALKNAGVGVHCGEGGAFAYTPHKVVLRWLEDVLDILTSSGIGYALWNFRGAFGILDSGRKDVQYEDWRGHKLDREMLGLLQKY